MDHTSPNRPRANSHAWSHRSDKSNGSKPKETVAESPADKKRRDSFWKGGSKANPNAAINEAQPGDAAILEKTTMDSLRNAQYKDRDGNIIAEPDLSNPTRARFERPLDTIRSFEKNIEAGYKRKSVTRGDSYDPRDQYASHSRRSSYLGANDKSSQFTQYHGGYYGAQRRADGLNDDGASPLAPPSRNRFGQRMGGPMSRSPSAYGTRSPSGQNYHDYDAAINSDSTGQWNNSTDPSSENSSIDRAHAAALGVKPQSPPLPVDGYVYNDANGAPIMEEYDSGSDGYGMSRRQNNGPAIPNHAPAPAVRAPIQLGGSASSAAVASQGGSLPSMARKGPEAKEEKKKGFFKKRFSKA